MAINNTQIGGGYIDILTVPNDGSVANGWAVTTILFCNTALPEDIGTQDGDTFLDLHLCKAGAAAGPGNMVLNNIPIPAGETFSFDTEKIILEPSDVITAATTSPTNITATVSYIEV
jgi:hypothetical protein